MDRKEAAQREKEVFEVYEKDLNLTFVVVRSHRLLCNLSDLISYQAILYSAFCAALAIGASLDGQLVFFKDPLREVDEALAYFFWGCMMSLLAAVFVLFAKERLIAVLLREGGPLVDRRALGLGGQQNACAFKTWQFYFLLRAPRFLLQLALLVPVGGFAQRLFSNIGVMFFFAVVVVPALVGYLFIPDR